MKGIQSKILMIDEIIRGDFDAEETERLQGEIDGAIDHLLFDNALVDREIIFDETEVVRNYDLYFRSMRVRHNSFDISPDRGIIAIQTEADSVTFYDQDGEYISQYHTPIGSDYIRNFYFTGNSDQKFVVDFPYEDVVDGVVIQRQMIDFRTVIDLSKTALQASRLRYEGDLWLEDQYHRVITWHSGSNIRITSSDGGYELPGSSKITRTDTIQLMKAVGEFLICQTDLTFYCFRIVDGKSGLEHEYPSFASAIFGHQVAFVDTDDSRLKILDLKSGRLTDICEDVEGLNWQITFDKTGQNLITIDIEGVVRVINIRQKRIISRFKAFSGDEFFPTQIGYTGDDKIIVSGGHGKRITKLFTLPGLEKWQN